MNESAELPRQGQRLLQIGVGLLLYASVEGFVIPLLRSQRVALSVHTLAALQAVLLLAVGLLWPRLLLGRNVARAAFWCLIYSTLAILGTYTIAAAWGVGNETIRLAGELPHGLTRGSVLQERLIELLAYSSAPTGLVAFVLIFWGIRLPPATLRHIHVDLINGERKPGA